MYKKRNQKGKLFTGTLVAASLLFAQSVFATTEEEPTFSTVEQKDSLLHAKEGQQQVRLVALEEQKEIRLAEEARIAEEERLAEEARLEEERLIAEAKAQKEAEEAERQRVAEAIALKEKKEAEAKASEEKPVQTASTSSNAAVQSGSNLGTFEATAYGADCYGCSGITANGTDIRNGNIYTSDGYRVIAADPRVIPMESIVKITLGSGQVIMGKVSDTGGRIKGNIIDIAFATEAETIPFGRQSVQVELIK